MKKNLLLGMAALLMIGCGGGGGGGSSTPAPITQESLVGKYSLSGFTIVYSNGVTLTESDPRITSFSGNLELGPTTGRVTYTVNGISSTSGGPYTATFTTATSGTMTGPGDSFTLNNGNLMIHIIGSADGLTFEEWDYWQKYSGTSTMASPEHEDAIDLIDEFQSIAPMLY